MTEPTPSVLAKPIVFVGMPRSGTTILFERFAMHPDLGWLSNYSETFPGWPVLNLLCPLLDNPIISLRGQKKQYTKLFPGNRFLPRPEEAYGFWGRYADSAFARDYLLNTAADEQTRQRVRAAIAKTLKYQNKKRFVIKFTGPGRIAYLKSIFPDAQFVHVIRDGRAVVDSLLRVKFWKQKGGLDAPFWNNGLPEALLDRWRSSRHKAVALASVQWVFVIESIRNEARSLDSGQYREIRYEQFVETPENVLRELDAYCGVDSAQMRAYSGLPLVRDANQKYRNLDPDEVAEMSDIMGGSLRDLGYV